MRMKKICSNNIGFKWYDILFLLVIAVAFFSLPLMFQADSTVYLSNSEFFAGTSPNYLGIRGPVVPFVLMMFGKLFSYTVYGLTVGLFLTYLVFVASVLICLHLLEIPKLIGRHVTLLLATVVMFLNVVILAYAHVILTEFFIITFIAVYAAIMLAFYRYRPQEKKKIIIKEIALSVISIAALIVAYAIKQMFFPIIVLMYACYKIVDIKGKLSIKRVLKEILVVFLMVVSLFSYINIYSGATSGNNMEGDSVSNYAGSFLIDGLRYFVPQGDIVYGEETTIFINDDAINAIDSFTFTFEPGIANSIEYVATCFANSPSRWFASYKANYGVISGVIRCGVDGVSRKYTPVSTTLHFDFLYESGAWVDHFKILSPQLLSYPQEFGTEVSQQMFGHQVVDTGLVSNLLFNTRYANLSIVFHTTAVYFSPIILLVALGLIIASKKYAFINKKLCIINALLSVNMFFYILFLATTAQNIERYGIPMIFFAGIMWIVNLAYLISFVAKKIKAKRAEASQERQPA